MPDEKGKKIIIDETSKILALDTSSNYLSIALSKGDKILNNVHLEAPRDHLAKLLPMIDELLNAAAVNLLEIDVILVGTGPGSFTGLRIGVATAEGLAQSLNKNIIGISSLDAIARGIERDQEHKYEGIVCTVVDAKRKEIYAKIFKQGESDSVPQVLDPVDLGNILKRYEERVVLAGDGLLLYGDLFKESLGERAVFARKELWYPKATLLVGLSLKKRATLAYRNVRPIYIRKSEAEERLKRLNRSQK